MIVFDNKTLEEIAALICGDRLTEKYCDEEEQFNCPFYRKGSELPIFFENAGLKCPDFGNASRKPWTLSCLKYYNTNSQMENVLLRLADPKEYGDKSKTQIVVKELNKILELEGLSIRFNGIKPIIADIEPQILVEELNGNYNLLKLDFDQIIPDKNLSLVLNSRWNEIGRCMNSEAFLSSIILMGSILEGVLLSVVESNIKESNLSKSAPKDESGQILRFKNWTLNDLINVTHDCGWIGKDVKDFNDKLRDYRNLVHPRKQRDEDFFPDEDTCKICLSVVLAALNDLKDNI
jgi:hypothetical protein